jgi:hypothetical protein
MPEVTESYIRIPVHECTSKEIRTISISTKQGIKALYCIPHKKIKTYLFLRKKGWTMPKAKAWIKKHKEGGKMEKGSLYRLYTKAKYEFGKSISGEAKVMKGVEILRTGEFKGYVWDIKKMKKAVSNFRKLKKNNIFPDVPIRINHGGMFGSGVESVCGYINDLHVKVLDKEKAVMTADCEFIDQEVIDDIESAQKNERRGKFIKRSIEFGPYVDNKGNEHDPVIYGYAFVDIPAVEELKPLPAFAFSKFTNNKKVVELNKEEFMPEEKENIENDEEEKEEEPKEEELKKDGVEEPEENEGEGTEEDSEEKEEDTEEEGSEEETPEEEPEQNDEENTDEDIEETPEEDEKEKDVEENEKSDEEAEEKEDDDENDENEEKEVEGDEISDDSQAEDSHKWVKETEVESLNHRLDLVNSYLKSDGNVKTTPAMAEFEMTILSLIPAAKHEEAVEAYKKLKEATPSFIVLDKTKSEGDIKEPDTKVPGEVSDKAATQKARQTLKDAGYKITKVE